MRIRRLYLKAFGIFSETELDFSATNGRGLHVIFGPNEAGKSTSLRAVKGLFFGIPQTTSDDFRHPASKLCVGAELETAERRFTLFRQRKRVNSLQDERGQPVPEETLRSLLGGLDEGSFSRRVGLDQDELDSGAEALLAGAEEGLFAAGTGGADVRLYLDELRRRSEELYKRQGKNPSLNRSIQRYGEAKATLQKNVRAPEHYEQQARQLEATERERRTCEEERRRLRDEQREGTRLSGVLPALSAYRDEVAALAALGDFVLLPEGATAEREALERELGELRVMRRETEREIERASEGLLELPSTFPRAALRERLPELESRLGSERKAMLDLPKLRARLGALEVEIEEILRGLGFGPEVADVLGDAARRIPPEHEILGVRAARSECAQLEAALEGLEAGLEEEPESDDLPALPSESDFGTLVGLVAEGRAMAPVLERYRERHQALRVLGVQSAALEEKLAGRRVDDGFVSTEAVDDLVREVRDSENRARELETELGASRRASSTLAARLERVERELVSSGREGELPREPDLRRAREERDERITSTLRGDASASELWRSVVHADDTVDRMRRAAEELSRLERLESERAELLELRAREEQRAEDLHAQSSALDARLKALFSARGVAFAGGSTADFVERLQQLAMLRTSRDEWEAEAGALRSALEDLEGRMRSFGRTRFPELGELKLSGWLEVLAGELDERRAARERRADASKRRAREEARRRTASKRAGELRQRIAEVRGELEERLARLGLKSELRDSELEALLAGFSELGRKLHEARELKKRVDGIERDTELLSAYLDELSGPAPSGLSLVERGENFVLEVREEGALLEERTRLEGERERRRQQLAALAGRVDGLEVRLEELCARARVRTLEELSSVERRSDEFRRRTAVVERLRAEIVRESGGESFDALLERASATTPARLASRLDEIGDQLERVETRIRELEADVGGLSTALARFRTVDVADARQLAEMRAAEARSLVRDFVRTELQRRVLSDQMERFAASFAGPLLRRSGELFAALTLGAYRGVRVEERTLLCLRENEEVDVRELSRGTRAQLYFALRVASLEKYFTESPEVPLVFDDLFVDFDDDRATAAFEVLASLAERTQVLYFTHLSRDVEVASSASRDVRIHRLGVG